MKLRHPACSELVEPGARECGDGSQPRGFLKGCVCEIDQWILARVVLLMQTSACLGTLQLRMLVPEGQQL